MATSKSVTINYLERIKKDKKRMNESFKSPSPYFLKQIEALDKAIEMAKERGED